MMRVSAGFLENGDFVTRFRVEKNWYSLGSPLG